jgi:hypothetical protein
VSTENSTQSSLGPSETLRALAAKSHPPAPLDMAPTMTPKQLLEQVASALKTEHNDEVVMGTTFIFVFLPFLWSCQAWV